MDWKYSNNIISKSIAIVSMVMLFVCCDGEKVDPQKIAQELVTPPDLVEDLNLKFVDSGLVTTTVQAKQVQFLQTDDEARSIFPKGVTIHFYNPDGSLKNYLKGDYGTWDRNTGLAEVKYNVKVVNNAGDSLLTEQLFWDSAKKQIYTEKLVHIKSPTNDVWGLGLTADQNFKTYQIKNIRGQIRLNNKKAEEK